MSVYLNDAGCTFSVRLMFSYLQIYMCTQFLLLLDQHMVIAGRTKTYEERSRRPLKSCVVFN